MARAHVIVKPSVGGSRVKHIARTAAGATLCGIPASSTMKAAGPATLRSICKACQQQADASK